MLFWENFGVYGCFSFIFFVNKRFKCMWEGLEMLKNKLIIVVLLVVCVGLCFACSGVEGEKDYLRIHIRANSNSIEDQNVKYVVKDVVVDYLTPYIASCSCYEDVVNVVLREEDSLEDVVNDLLVEEGFDYVCDMELNNEYFPTRTYQDLTLESNFYDAIIINLGEGQGDNWWCVVYPPLCFKDTNNVVYKSKLVELIKNIMG